MSEAKTQHFCILPWLHLQINQGGEVHPCCRMDDRYQLGSLAKNTLEEIWNGPAMRTMRMELKADRAVTQCASCYRAEKAGGISFRQRMNHSFAESLPLVKETHDDGSVAPIGLHSLDLRLSNVCNFSCRTCSPWNSTSWYRDAIELENKEATKWVKPIELNDEALSAIEGSLAGMRRIYFAGGEPLLHQQQYLLLEKLRDLGNRSVVLDYNTNFSHLQFQRWKATELWKDFESVHVGASLDGIGPQAEVIRKGTKWSQIEANFQRLKEEAPQVNFYIHSTVSAMNVFHLPTAIERWVELGMLQFPDQLAVNVLNYPRHLNIQILNLTEREHLAKKYADFLIQLKSKASAIVYHNVARGLRQILQSFSPEVWTEDREMFRRYTIKMDSIRKERFVDLFPEHLSLLYEKGPGAGPIHARP